MEDFQYDHNDAENNIEHELQETIICPYCGYDFGYSKSEKSPGNTTDAWKFDMECVSCDKAFSVSWCCDEEDGLILYSTYHVNQEDFV